MDACLNLIMAAGFAGDMGDGKREETPRVYLAGAPPNLLAQVTMKVKEDRATGRATISFGASPRNAGCVCVLCC